MPTDNPKVSAYVPQVLKDRLTQFRGERDISESQAVIIILAEYFEMKQEIGRASDGASVGGVTLARMEALEKQVSDLQSSIEQRFQELSESINNGRLNSGSQVDQKETLLDKSLVDKQGSEVDEDVQADSSKETIDEAAKEVVVSKENGSSDSRPPVESQDTASKSGLLFDIPSEPLAKMRPIQGIKLSQMRFGLSKGMVSENKRKKSPEEFIEWTRQHDPDGIAWKYVESPSKGYLPAGELTSEQQSSLLEWYEKINQAEN